MWYKYNTMNNGDYMQWSIVSDMVQVKDEGGRNICFLSWISVRNIFDVLKTVVHKHSVLHIKINIINYYPCNTVHYVTILSTHVNLKYKMYKNIKSDWWFHKMIENKILCKKTCILRKMNGFLFTKIKNENFKKDKKDKMEIKMSKNDVMK